MIYDLGGGTFDVSVLDIHGDVFEVVSTGGDTFLGGTDFDNRIVDLLADAFKGEHGIDLRHDPVVHQRLLFAAENAKCALSEREAVPVHVLFVGMKGTARSISAASFGARDQRRPPPIRRPDGAHLREVLAAKGLEATSVHELLRRRPEPDAPDLAADQGELRPRAYKGVHPDEAVACGAAPSPTFVRPTRSCSSTSSRSRSGSGSRTGGSAASCATRRSPPTAASPSPQAPTAKLAHDPCSTRANRPARGNELLGAMSPTASPAEGTDALQGRLDRDARVAAQDQVSDMLSGAPLNARFDTGGATRRRSTSRLRRRAGALGVVASGVHAAADPGPGGNVQPLLALDDRAPR